MTALKRNGGTGTIRMGTSSGPPAAVHLPQRGKAFGDDMMSIIYYKGEYKTLSQNLRRNMTRQEKHLWYDFLKSYTVTFRRQKQFGQYIVDFYCASARLVVELDGSQHYEPDAERHDAERDGYLSGLGLSVLRFGNVDIDRHFDGVCATIDREVRKRIDSEIP